MKRSVLDGATAVERCMETEISCFPNKKATFTEPDFAVPVHRRTDGEERKVGKKYTLV